MMRAPRFLSLLFLAVGVSLDVYSAAADPLADGFRQPPASRFMAVVNGGVTTIGRNSAAW
jgi:hypothetical protein